MDKTWIGLAVLLGAALLPPHAAAQKTYRCGNTFQDRPCSAAPAAATPAPAVAAPAAAATDTRPATEKRVQQSASAREARRHQDQRHQDLCESLSMQLEDVRNRQRAGGAAATMESFGRQRRDIEAKLSASRC